MEKLSNYLSRHPNHNFQVTIFSDQTNIQSYLENSSIDVIIITPLLYQENFIHHINSNNQNKKTKNNKIKEPLIILLTEDKIDKNMYKLPYIFKYQKGENIANKIIKYYTKWTDLELIAVDEEGCNTIGVYSPVGGCGKTTISILLSKALALKGENVLFISLEDIVSYKSILSTSGDESISDFIYYVIKKSNNVLMKLQGIVQKDANCNLNFLPPPIYPEDMLNITEEDWIDVISYIIKSKYYKYIIIDFTSCYSNRNIELLKLCTYIIGLTSNNLFAKEKILLWKKRLNENKNIFPPIIWVNNNIHSSIENTLLEENSSVDFHIPYNLSLQNNINIENNDIKEIIEKLIERIKIKPYESNII